MRTIGRAFSISKNQARGYSYVKAPKRAGAKRGRFRRNPGVTHIAAINGRGAYARSRTSARSRMSGLTKNARIQRAKAALDREQRKSFRSRLKTNSNKPSKSATTRRKNSMRRNAQTARQRAASLRNLRKARAARRKGASARKAAPRRRTARRATSAAPKRRRTARKSTGWTLAKRKAAGRKAARTRKRRAASKASGSATPVRRRRRRKLSANPRRRKATKRRGTARRRLRRNYGTSAGAKKGWRTRRARAAGKSVRRRKTRRPVTKRRRSLAAKRGWAKRRGMRANGRRRTTRRRLRRNARMSYVSNRRGRRRVTKNRRSMRRNSSRRRMRRNTGIGGAFRTGAWVVSGLLLQKVATSLIRDLVFKPTVEAVAPEAASEEPTSGLGQINGYGGIAVGVGVAVLGALAAKKFVKNPEDRKLIIGGIAAGALHSVIVGLADLLGSPKVATMLAGVEDGTAAKISAMYGLGAGTSIMPEYAPIGRFGRRRGMRGTGEYFASGVNGLGEYFASGVNGLGEYFASGVQGLGAVQPYEAAAGFGASYGSNPDLYQAAAGIGSQDNPSGSNFVDPSSDLDRELTIAEAAAGVGQMPYQAAAGFGATPVRTVPRASTWIPGTTDAPIWAGVRSINEPQSQHEMLTAGILQTDGGQGVFG